MACGDKARQVEVPTFQRLDVWTPRGRDVSFSFDNE